MTLIILTALLSALGGAAAGFAAGRAEKKSRTKAEKSSKTFAAEDKNAFDLLMGYSADVAYGLKNLSDRP